MSPYLPIPKKQDLTFDNLDFSILNDLLWIHEIRVEDDLTMTIRGYLKTSDLNNFTDLVASEINGAYCGLLQVLERFPVFHWRFPGLQINGDIVSNVQGDTHFVNVRGEVELCLRRKLSAKTH